MPPTILAAADLVSVPAEALQRAIDAFDPRNGRLQRYRLGGRDVLLNLAKNPTGFNQNLKIVEADRGPKMVAFFINDQVADGATFLGFGISISKSLPANRIRWCLPAARAPTIWPCA